MFRCSLAAALLAVLGFAIAGCGGKKTGDGFKPAKTNKTVKKAHGKHKPGPNEKGDVFDIGDHDYRAEVVFNETERRLTVYLLNHDNDKPVFADDKQIKLELTMKIDGKPAEVLLAAAPQMGDPAGKTSRFEIKGDALPSQIADEHDLKGEFEVHIGGEHYHCHLHEGEHKDGKGHKDHKHGKTDKD